MDEAKKWLEKAKEDLNTAKFLEKNDKLNHAAFLYQQAVEKGLKAVLIKKGKGSPHTHDCFVLSKKAKAPSKIIRKADRLSPYYFRTRYPDTALVSIDKEDIESLRKAVKEVFKWIRKEL